MRIVEVSPYASALVSGITTMVQDLARELAAQGHPTSILDLGGPKHQEIGKQSASNGPDQPPFLNFQASLRVACLLWKTKQDWELVHVHQAHPVSVAAAVVARLLGRPAVATNHVLPPRAHGLRGLLQAYFEWFQPFVCNETVYVSERTRQSFHGRGEVIRNGIAVAQIRANLGDRQALRKELNLDGFVIGFFGRHEKMKGYLDLLRAIRQVRDRGIDARLLAIGNTPTSEATTLAETVENLDLNPFITDLGVRDDRLHYLAAVDVVTLPSYNEGFPLALLEAMAAGRPVVATTVGGVAELVHDGSEGFLVSPGDVNALTDALFRMANSPIERTDLGRRALDRARAFDLVEVTSDYVRVFKRSVGE